MISPMETFLMKQTELMHQMMLQMNSTYKMNKPSATITRPIEDDGKDSQTLSDVSRGNSEDENGSNELVNIVNPIAIGDVVVDKDSEDVLSSMEMFFKQEEKCSDKIEDRMAKIVNESMRTRVGETK